MSISCPASSDKRQSPTTNGTLHDPPLILGSVTPFVQPRFPYAVTTGGTCILISATYLTLFATIASQTREQEGTGIGLALTKEVVELHHGTIEVQSEVGRGSEFIET